MGKASKAGVALAIGAAVGYAASLLVPDKTRSEQKKALEKNYKKVEKVLKDKKEQDRVKKVFAQYTQESVAAYRQAKSELATHLSTLGDALKDVDRKKYQTALGKALEKVKKDHKVPDAQLKKLQALFLADFKTVKEKLAVKKVAKKAKK